MLIIYLHRNLLIFVLCNLYIGVYDTHAVHCNKQINVMCLAFSTTVLMCHDILYIVTESKQTPPWYWFHQIPSMSPARPLKCKSLKSWLSSLGETPTPTDVNGIITSGQFVIWFSSKVEDIYFLSTMLIRDFVHLSHRMNLPVISV